MSPALKYTLGRIGIFVACAVLVLLPPGMNTLLKLMIAFLVSAGLSFFVLRQSRQDLADRLSENARRKIEEKERLRSALAGEDEIPVEDPDQR